MTPPTFSKAKPEKLHTWLTNKKRDYATLGRIKIGKGRDEPPVEPRPIDPVQGLKPSIRWIDCPIDKADFKVWLAANTKKK
jgi:hypothetical protein